VKIPQNANNKHSKQTKNNMSSATVH